MDIQFLRKLRERFYTGYFDEALKAFYESKSLAVLYKAVFDCAVSFYYWDVSTLFCTVADTIAAFVKELLEDLACEV